MAYACEMPSSIQFNTDQFEMNAPVKIARFNTATVLTKALKDSFPEGFEIYEMVNYPNTLAFLICYPMAILESFNPDDYLEEIREQMKSMKDFEAGGINPIHESITIPPMTTGTVNIPVGFNMQDFFDDMKDKINAGISPPHSESNVTFPYESPPFMEPYFDSITVDTGTIRLDIWLTGAAPDVTVDLTSVYFGVCGNTSLPQITSLYTAGSPCHIDIDIGGAVINKNTRFILNGTSSSSTFTLVMRPQIQNITLNAAAKLKIGKMGIDLPPGIVDNIININLDDNMLNAQIAEGEFRMTPHSYSGNSYGTNCNNMILGYNITMKQDPVVISGYSQPQPLSFPGLNEQFTDTNNSLDNRLISGNKLTVGDESKLFIWADPVNGTDFTFSGGGVKVLTIGMDMGINIRKLEIVNWKNILPSINVSPIDFSGDILKVFKSITFNGVALEVNFTDSLDLLENCIALQIDCPSLGFSNTLQPLKGGMNIITGKKEKLSIPDPSVPFEVPLDVKLVPLVNGQLSPYIMQFGSVLMNSNGYNMDINAVVDIKIKWEEAEIDVQAAIDSGDSSQLEGVYPDSSGDPVDLTKIGKYMNGITFGNNLKAKVFLSGPHKLFNLLKPKLDFTAKWNDREEKLFNEEELKIDKDFPNMDWKDSNSKWVYPYIDLPNPESGIPLIDSGSLNKIFEDFPQNLTFNYKVILPGGEEHPPLIVYPHTFDGDLDDKGGAINAMLVILLPLEFTVKQEGFFTIPDLFEDGKDLFGREDPHDSSLFTGVNIKSLGIKIDFGYPLFDGAYLHFDKGNEKGEKLFGDNGFPLGKGNSLNITFTGDQQRFIEENLIIPDVRFKFPHGGTMRIGKNLLPVKIIITASGSVTVNFDDLGLGN
jgi:hypothetical protein